MMRAVLKRVPLLVQGVRAMRRLPGATTVRKLYADAFPGPVFRAIYRENQWSDAESRSGEGSNLHATVAIREAIPALLRDLQVRTLLDVPCGDFHWMRVVDVGAVSYTGCDIVPDLIAYNQAQYGRPGVAFRVLNAATDPLPTVDCILCRDLLIHLSFASIAKVLANVRASGSTWFAVSTYPTCITNTDIVTGSYRPVNLEAAPLDFPPPVRAIREEFADGPSPDKWLGVWRVSDLPA